MGLRPWMVVLCMAWALLSLAGAQPTPTSSPTSPYPWRPRLPGQGQPTPTAPSPGQQSPPTAPYPGQQSPPTAPYPGLPTMPDPGQPQGPGFEVSDPLRLPHSEIAPKAPPPDTTSPIDLYEFPDARVRSKLLDAFDRQQNRWREFFDTKLPRFGDHFFSKSRDELTRSEEGVMPADYILRPGDELNMVAYNLKGGESAAAFGIDQKGQAYVPGLGPMAVGGLTLAAAQQQLNQQVQTKLPNFRIQLSMTKVRKMRVFVFGEARQPGGLLVNPDSTLLDGLLACGGPSESGSYRKIELQRHGHIMSTLDLYEVFLKGKTFSPRLREGDRIFIPAAGPQVGLAGEVMRPAQYEVLHEKNLGQMMALAGGVKPSADRKQIQLLRLVGNDSRKMRDVQLSEVSKLNVKNGDLVVVQPLLEDLANTVFIDGAVKRPGPYSVPKNLRVRDLLAKAAGMRDGAYAGRAEIYRRPAPDMPLELISFDLSAALSGPASDVNNPIVKPRDYVVIYGYADSFVNSRVVRIQGEVGNPGDYARYDNMRLRDLLFQAQGLSSEASSIIEIASRGPEGQLSRRNVDVNAIMSNPNAPENVALLDLDTVIVRKDLRARRWPATILLTGEFNHPGKYTIDTERDSLADIIKMAGGLTDRAYLRGSVFVRQRGEVLDPSQEQLGREIFNLLQDIADRYAVAEQARTGKTPTPLPVAGAASANLTSLASSGTAPGVRDIGRILATTRIPIGLAALLNGQGTDPGVRDGDTLYVPTPPQTVIVAGAVVVPSPVLFEEGRDVDYYISQAGGLTDDAAADKIFVISANGAVIRREQVKRMERGDVIITPPQAIIARAGGLEIFLNLTQSVLNYLVLGRVFQR